MCSVILVSEPSKTAPIIQYELPLFCNSFIHKVGLLEEVNKDLPFFSVSDTGPKISFTFIASSSSWEFEHLSLNTSTNL